MVDAGSEAYRWLDRHSEYMLETPDEAFDWVFMLTDDDWDLIDASWEQRSAASKEAIAYVVCEGPSRDSRRMLLRALRDPNSDVAGQAAESLASQRELDEYAFPTLDFESERMVATLTADDESDKNGGEQ
ncbi:hypothetical protein CA13_65580 [Planctomycetes bacterium CA13]|uniref:HEAT repeat protein n=1 Tax=Novipirellula herctigrandis TaxID=2527986 RepID=A0A5C5ZD17_9BACT|nr:hypothetical protein CA13_65580 [Planctomycetes bacterium CA13]